jgi:hypothetical protein
MSKSNRALCGGRSSVLVLALGLAIVASLHPGAPRAQVTGISYTLTPMVEGIRFADDAALKSALFYGGKLGFGFGEYIELGGLYLFGPNAKTAFGNLTGFDDATTSLLRALPARSLDIHRFGGELKFNIGRGSVFPFVTLGTGALRFDPEGLNESKTIYLSGGLGLQFSRGDRYTIVLQATGLAYRYNPEAAFMSEDDLAAVGLGVDDFDLVDVRSFGASIGAKFYLGGRRPGKLSEMDRAFQSQFSRGWRGIDFRIEPASGEIDFDEALGYRRNHRFANLSAGIDLGSHAGLRAFYWRGVKDDAWTFDDVQAYGGELKLTFADGSGGLAPYFTVGGGYMDVLEGYAGNGFAPPESRPFAFGGVGLILPLGSALSLDAALRSILMSTAGVDNVSAPGSIETSTMFTVGLSFGLGGGRSRNVFGREMAASRVERKRLASELSGLELELESLRSRMDSMEAVAEGRLVPRADTAALRAVAKDAARDPRWVTLPVPEEGELYMRYGSPGGVSIETIEGEPVTYYIDPSTGALTLVSPSAVAKPAAPGVAASPASPTPAAIPRETAAPAAQAVPAAAVAGTESLESIVRRVLREERSAEAAAAPKPTAPVQEAPPAVIEAPKEKTIPVKETAALIDETSIEEAEPAEPSIRFAAISPLAGFSFNDPTQGLLGLRADFVHRTRPYRLAPEIIMGFGDDETTVNVNLNGLVDFGFGAFDRLYPYGGVGIGLLNGAELEFVLNLVLGSDIRIGTSTTFLEYVSQNFFDNNRILAGYRFDF